MSGVDGRSPKTGGKPLRSRNPRSEEYSVRTLFGSTLLTARTMREWLASDARVGNGEDASGTATIQATSRTPTTPITAPSAESQGRRPPRMKRAFNRPARNTPSNWPTVARTSTQTMATGICARPLARCEPIGFATWAPTTAPPKNPISEKTPTSAPLRKPPIPYASAATRMMMSRTFTRWEVPASRSACPSGPG
jgi:hypothetical protein